MAAHTAKRALIIAACAAIPFAAACGSDNAPTPSSSNMSTSSTSTSSPSSTTSTESTTDSPSESSSPQDSPNPTRGQNTEPTSSPRGGASTSARPTGYTEAPGQAEPSEMNKTVASCGDPALHETGTTFFTDGSSGWTQQCASQMMAQQPAATPEPAPAPAPAAPAPEQQEYYVTPGAYCSGGGTGVSKNGTPMTCSVGPDGEARWRSQ